MKTVIEMAKEAGIFAIFKTLHPSIEIFAELVRADERAACAKVCEDKNTLLEWPTYAAAIRARGQQ